MGGGLLTVYSSSIHHYDKAKTRGGIAYGYLLMGLLQYSSLVYLHPGALSATALYFIAIAAMTYLLLGRMLFAATTEQTFQSLVTSMILAYGVLLLVR